MENLNPDLPAKDDFPFVVAPSCDSGFFFRTRLPRPSDSSVTKVWSFGSSSPFHSESLKYDFCYNSYLFFYTFYVQISVRNYRGSISPTEFDNQVQHTITYAAFTRFN